MAFSLASTKWPTPSLHFRYIMFTLGMATPGTLDVFIVFHMARSRLTVGVEKSHIGWSFGLRGVNYIFFHTSGAVHVSR